MKFSYNWIASLSNEKIPTPEELAKLLTMKLFEVEEIKKKGDDWIIDIDILPSRAGDCFSHIGITREISAAIGFEFEEPKVEIKESDKDSVENMISAEVTDSSDCPRYVAKIVTGVKVGPSPQWIKDKLETCGIQSINNIVDIANYVMLETGQPLHAFDMEKISGNIIVRRADKKEEIQTLDDKKYELNENILTIADKEKLLGIAGIKGGKSAEISQETTDIVIESAAFNRKVIRKGSAKLKLRTDASMRFEHGFDPNMCEFAAERTASLISEVAGGTIAKGSIDIYPEKIQPKNISLSLERTEKLLGVKVVKDEAKKILSLLGFLIKEEDDDLLIVEVPTRRVDVLLPEDLMEEIGRLIGYEKTPSKLPRMEVLPPKKNIGLFWEQKIKDVFKAAGSTEIYNHTFISEEQSRLINHDSSDLIEVESPVSIEQKYLRPSLIPHLVKNIKENEKFFDEIEIFELGKTFSHNNGERKMLAGAITGDSFYQLKGILELLFKEMGIDNIEYLELKKSPSYIHPAKRSGISIEGVNLGYIGFISSEIKKEMKITSDFFLFELDFEKMINVASDKKEYIPLAKHPETTRDMAIMVPLIIPFKNIVDVITGLKIPLLKDIELFDVYRGKGVPEDKKSLALRLTYQGDRTLTAEEVNKFQEKVIEKMEEQNDWQVRK